MSIERIRKLLAMTTANGCTEAEAMAAAEKAARLMTELGVQFGDLEFGAEQIKPGASIQSVRVRLWNAIAECTNTDFVLKGDGQLEYVGREPWPEVARYLHDLTHRSVNRELRAFHASRWYKRRSSLRAKRAATHDFTVAMIHRLAVKLMELFASTRSRAAFAEAQAEVARRYPNTRLLGERQVRPNLRHYWNASAAGAVAGESVQVSHGVGGTGSDRLRIGGAS